jgi:hypothetical protein
LTARRKASTRRTKGAQPRPRTRAKAASARGSQGVAAARVSAAELRALKRELERRMKPQGRAPMRWNPDPEDVQKSVAQLVLTVVEFLRQLMERQAIRRMERRTLTDQEIEAVGVALMRLEETVRDMGKRFGLSPEDLNLDLGAIKLM